MAEIVVGGKPAEISVFSLSPVTVRITVRPIVNGAAMPIPATGALVQDEFGSPVVVTRSTSDLTRVKAGDLIVRFTDAPPTLHVETARGDSVQRLTLDAAAP